MFRCLSPIWAALEVESAPSNQSASNVRASKRECALSVPWLAGWPMLNRWLWLDVTFPRSIAVRIRDMGQRFFLCLVESTICFDLLRECWIISARCQFRSGRCIVRRIRNISISTPPSSWIPSSFFMIRGFYEIQMRCGRAWNRMGGGEQYHVQGFTRSSVAPHFILTSIIFSSVCYFVMIRNFPKLSSHFSGLSKANLSIDFRSNKNAVK